MRKLIAGFTAFCVAVTPVAAPAGPHEEGVAAGQAANPAARATVNAPSATSVVPGYTAAPPESAYYRRPNLSSQGSARLPTLPNVATLQGQSSGRIPTCYYGQGRCQ